MRTIKALALAVAAAAPIWASEAKAAEHNWRMQTEWGGGPLMDLGAKAFAERIKFVTDGRIEVQVLPVGTVAKGLESRTAVANGVVEACHTWIGYDWGKDKTTVLLGGFSGSMDSERMLHWLYEGGGLELWRQFNEEKFNLVSMPLFARTAEAFLHSRKPVKTLEELKGLKLRTAGAWLEISRQLGAASLTTPGAETYPMLERGAIDATEWGTLYENISMGFHKIAKYVIIPGVHQPSAPFELCVNKTAWGKLSDRDKKLVELTSRQVTLESWMRVGAEDAKALKFFREQGNEIIELAPEVQKATKDMSVKWADEQAKENAWFKKIWESQRAFEKRTPTTRCSRATWAPLYAASRRAAPTTTRARACCHPTGRAATRRSLRCSRRRGTRTGRALQPAA